MNEWNEPLNRFHKRSLMAIIDSNRPNMRLVGFVYSPLARGQNNLFDGGGGLKIVATLLRWSGCGGVGK